MQIYFSSSKTTYFVKVVVNQILYTPRNFRLKRRLKHLGKPIERLILLNTVDKSGKNKSIIQKYTKYNIYSTEKIIYNAQYFNYCDVL